MLRRSTRSTESTGIVPAKCPDYLAHPALRSYFELREAEVFLKSQLHKYARREAYDSFINAATTFLGYCLTPENRTLVDQTVFGPSRQGRKQVKGAFDRADEPGLNASLQVLGLDLPITFKSLKTAYRSKAKTFHPDKGGSHEKMVSINEAYDALHDRLCNCGGSIQQPSKSHHETSLGLRADFPHWLKQPASVYEYAAMVHDMLFHIYDDDWDIRLAWSHLCTALSEYRNCGYKTAYKYLLVVSGPMFLAKLAHCNMETESKQLHKMILKADSSVLSRAAAWHRDHPRRKSAIVITHMRQAENLMTLGIISEERFMRAIERFDREEGEDTNKAVDLRNFLASGGFIRYLAYDDIAGVMRDKTIRVEKLPALGYFNSDLRQLSDDHKTEYFIAFSSESSVSLVRKYAGVRLESIFRSIIMSFAEPPSGGTDHTLEQISPMKAGHVPVRHAIGECELIAKIQAKNSRLGRYCDGIRKMLCILDGASEPELSQYIAILKNVSRDTGEPQYQFVGLVDIQMTSILSCLWSVLKQFDHIAETGKAVNPGRN